MIHAGCPYLLKISKPRTQRSTHLGYGLRLDALQVLEPPCVEGLHISAFGHPRFRRGYPLVSKRTYRYLGRCIYASHYAYTARQVQGAASTTCPPLPSLVILNMHSSKRRTTGASRRPRRFWWHGRWSTPKEDPTK